MILTLIIILYYIYNYIQNVVIVKAHAYVWNKWKTEIRKLAVLHDDMIL